MESISLFDAIHTQRAIRRFKPDPVPDEAIATVIEAATRAPNGRNGQPWFFLVVRDRELKRKLGEWYLEGWGNRKDDAGRRYADVDPLTLPQASRGGAALGRGMADIPLLIFVWEERADEGGGPPIASGASIYPAVQNLMLAARGLGLGTVLTTIHIVYEQQVRELLGVPPNVRLAAVIPMGYPAEGESFGGSRRKPVEEVTFHDRWGRKRSTG